MKKILIILTILYLFTSNSVSYANESLTQVVLSNTQMNFNQQSNTQSFYYSGGFHASKGATINYSFSSDTSNYFLVLNGVRVYFQGSGSFKTTSDYTTFTITPLDGQPRMPVFTFTHTEKIPALTFNSSIKASNNTSFTVNAKPTIQPNMHSIMFHLKYDSSALKTAKNTLTAKEIAAGVKFQVIDQSKTATHKVSIYATYRYKNSSEVKSSTSTHSFTFKKDAPPKNNNDSSSSTDKTNTTNKNNSNNSSKVNNNTVKEDKNDTKKTPEVENTEDTTEEENVSVSEALPSLLLNLSVDNNIDRAKVGDKLSYIVKADNTGETDLENLVVDLPLEDKRLKYENTSNIKIYMDDNLLINGENYVIQKMKIMFGNLPQGSSLKITFDIIVDEAQTDEQVIKNTVTAYNSLVNKSSSSIIILEAENTKKMSVYSYSAFASLLLISIVVATVKRFKRQRV